MMRERNARGQPSGLTAVILALISLSPLVIIPIRADEKGTARQMKKVEFGGWRNNLRIVNGDAELLITLDVGPRILSYKLTGGENALYVSEKDLGKSGEPNWVGRGGHRLWTAPEDTTRTYSLDNEAVSYEEKGPLAVVTRPPADHTHGIQKEMEVHLEPQGSRVTVIHRITNIGEKPTQLAPWCLTVMAPGGTEIIPLPPSRPHPGPPENAKGPSDFGPDRLFVAWPYLDFTDSRWHLGQKFVTLTYDSSKGPTKLGMALRTGWVGYLNQGTLFVKRFDYQEGATYPDFGCNFETYSDSEIVEIESLGALVNLAPGQTAEMSERWELIGDVGAVHSESDIERLVAPKIKAH